MSTPKMPITPYPLALIQLWIANPGLLWSNPVWQSVTHVVGELWAYDHGKDVAAATRYHDVTGWTVGKAQAVEAFIKNYNDHEGRCLWNTWVKTSWAKWNINKLVDEIFKDSGCVPHNIMARLNWKITDDFLTMEAVQVKQIISIKLADVLFGNDAFTNRSFLALPIVMFVSTVLVSMWSRYQKVIKRQANSINKKTKEVDIVHTYMNKLETLITLLSVFKDQEMAKNLDACREHLGLPEKKLPFFQR
ncbi:hypothetical protein BDR06DRAFT_1005291 [Suillus hirtellus]|nr:hypothetical protein BDR06DRAFT_1005291 [Suillus hirtellus]